MAKKKKPRLKTGAIQGTTRFRRGGPMRHKNKPRGGDRPDPEIEEALEELEEDEPDRPAHSKPEEP